VVKFQKPFKTLKINGKSHLGDITSSINTPYVTTDKSQVKLDFKAASGWKITSTTVSTDTGKRQKLKSGKTYSLGERGYLAVSIYMQHKKNGAVVMNSFHITNAPLSQGM
jgi:hypothetical protein